MGDFNQIVLLDGLSVTNGQRPVVHGVVNRTPDTGVLIVSVVFRLTAL